MAGTGLGVLAKAAFRIEGGEVSGTGLVLSTYPLTPTLADAEEMVLGGSDMIPFLSEGMEDEYQFDYDQTLIGGAATPSSDIVGIKGSGSLEIAAMYDGLDALIGCALGFERPDLTGYSPVYENSVALEAAAGITASTWKDENDVFTSTAVDAGKFIKVKDGTGAMQVRRISAVTDTKTCTITPDWDTPTTGETPSAADTAVMAFEFTHTFECCNNLMDQLWSDVYGSLPAGVLIATDQIIRRGTLGIEKNQTYPWIFRSCMVNSMSFKGSSGSAITMSADLVPFDLDRVSNTTNPASTTWDWDNSSDIFEMNERVIYSDIDYIQVAVAGDAPLDSGDNMGISSFELAINNNLQVDDQDATTGNYRTAPARGGMREITGSFTIPRYENDTWLDWRDDQEKLIAKISVSGSTLTGDARNMTIYINSFKLEKASVPVTGAEALNQTFNFRAFVPASTPTGFPAQTALEDNNPLGEITITTLNQSPWNVFCDMNKEY